MAAPTYETRLIDGRRCGDGTGIFRFERPAEYRERAGQWLRLTLGTREGAVTHTLSDAAAPSEPTIDVAVRLTGSPFKDALLGLSPGATVSFQGPGGRLAIPEDARRVAFLMGGVGIAPARSLIRDRVLRNDASAELVLFYGNNDSSCVPFGDEFRDIDDRLDWFSLVEVIARPDPGWTGETGFITAELVRRHLDTAGDWRYVVAGPPAMLEPMRAVLDDLGVPAESRLFESFTGYE
jgi:ferredoxin-NADP reductase